MTFEKRTSAGFLANHLARLFAQGLQARIKPLGLTIGTFPALLELWEEDGLTQKALVERLDIEQATMANTLRRMERDGLVQRCPHPADGRSQQVWLTPTARSLRDDALAAATAQNEFALAGLAPDEKELFIRLMTRTIARMRSQ